MYPVLYPANSTSWETFGIGVLSSAISCEVQEERNGPYELEMQYPISGVLFDQIALRNIIVAKPNYTDSPQPFRIYSISKPIDGIVTISAQHISYDLSGYIDAPFTAPGIQTAISKMVDNTTVYPLNCPFVISSDMSSSVTMTLKHPQSVRALMGGVAGSLIDTYGGEWHFDGYNCILNAARGENRGVIIKYGKNLLDLTQEENNSAVYTGVYPYYYNTESDILVTLPEKVIEASGTYDFVKILPLDFTSDYQEPPTESELRSKAQSYINSHDIGIPKVNLKIKFLEVDSFIERVDLCDVVSVRFEKLGVSATAKCIRTLWDVLRERYIEAELGSAKKSLAETIADSVEMEETLHNFSSQLETTARGISDKITGNLGGYIVLHDTNNDGRPDEILIMDTEDIATAIHVIRLNNAGIAFSKTGYFGTYETAWNINGEFVADFIASGSLRTNLVEIIGDTQFSWDDANITIISPSDPNRMIRLGKYDGTNYGLGFSVDGGTTWKAGFDFNGIKVIGDVDNDGTAEMDGDSFDITNSSGISLVHIGNGQCIDSSGNYVTAPFYRFGTYITGGEHGEYSFCAGRMNNPSGPYSVCAGYKNTTKTSYTVAIGNECNAESTSSIALGYQSKVTGDNSDHSIAIGWRAEATGSISAAIGAEAKASGFNSFAIGYYSSAEADGAFAAGFTAKAKGEDSVALGKSSQAVADYSIAIGNATASAKYACAIGNGNTASGTYSFACGRDNTSSGTCCFATGRGNTATSYQLVSGVWSNNNSAQNALVVGNGTSNTSRSNAMYLTSGGGLWIAGYLNQGSDGRQKSIIGEVPDLSSVRAVKFKWNDLKPRGDDLEHIGYIAQDVEKIAPYLVGEDANGYKSLDYIGLLCAKIEFLERKVEQLSRYITEREGA